MNDLIPLVCPRCKSTWEKSLSALECIDKIYRQSKGAPPPSAKPAPAKIGQYRDLCPICGTYVIVTVKKE